MPATQIWGRMRVVNAGCGSEGVNGAGYEIRTRDIQLGKLTLYQLS